MVSSELLFDTTPMDNLWMVEATNCMWNWRWVPPCSLCNKSLQLGIAKYGGDGGWLPYSLETEGRMYPNNESHDKKITFGSLVPISKSFEVFRGTLHTTQAASLEIQAPSGYRCLRVQMPLLMHCSCQHCLEDGAARCFNLEFGNVIHLR